MLLAHHPEAVEALRRPTPQSPLRVLVSGCLAGLPCGVEGTDYGLGAVLADLLALPTLEVFHACPEDFGIGTPRTMPDLHGGDGHGVLDGRARVLDEHGTDLTERMLRGARHMLETATRHAVELCILTDMSAACGTQVISLGCRFDDPRRFQNGPGVAAALLLRAGYPVVSQRDHRTLARVRARVDPRHVPDPSAIDWHESDWYRATFPRRPPAPKRQ